MVRTAPLVLFLLAACTKPVTSDDVDVADSNARAALGQVADLTSRVDQLETEKEAMSSRIDDLETQLRQAKSETEEAQAQADNAQKRVDWLESVLNIH